MFGAVVIAVYLGIIALILWAKSLRVLAGICLMLAGFLVWINSSDDGSNAAAAGLAVIMLAVFLLYIIILVRALFVIADRMDEAHRARLSKKPDAQTVLELTQVLGPKKN